LDALGRAAAWVHDYGGGPGTGFVFLRPTNEFQLLKEFRRVAEYGVARDVGGASR
jgi:hypothetical protein